MRLDQGNQTLQGHHLIHLDQEALAAGLLTFAEYSASAKGICFTGAEPFESCEASISPEMEVFFRVSLVVV